MDRFRDPAALIGVLGDWMAGSGVLYRRLAVAIEAAVDDGELVAGDRLPAERALAGALAISRATVVAAYDELRSRGVLESRQGSGTRVARDPGRRRTAADTRISRGQSAPIVRRFGAESDDVISMTYALETGVPELQEAVLEVAEADLPVLLTDVGYHPRGLHTLRSAVAAHYTDLGLATEPEQVLVTTGAHQAIVLVAQLYLHTGSAVVIESPSWPGCFDAFGAVGGRVVGVELDEDGIRADLLEGALAADNPALMFVMPTFHNPTGRLMSASRRRQLAQLAARHGIPLLEDNAYSAPVDSAGQSVPPPIAAFAPRDAEVLTVGSMSKSVWGGLRIGWVRAAQPVIDRLAAHKAHADLGSPLLDQAIAARLIPRLPELADARARVVRRKLRHITSLLEEHLPQWRWDPPDGGSALWIELPDTDAAVFAQVALRHGVEVVPGAMTDPSGTWDSFIRLPFSYEVEVLTEVVQRLRAAWKDLERYGPLPADRGLRAV